MKASQVRRKRQNAARSTPRPARLFKVAPTLGNSDPIQVGICSRRIGETKLSRTRWLRAKRRTVNVVCGGPIMVTRGPRRGRKVYCQHCRVRRAEARQQARDRQRKPWQHATHRPPVSRLGVFRRFSRKTI